MSRDSADRNPPSVGIRPATDITSEPSDLPSPRRRFPRVSASPRCPATIPEHPDEELWVDGPRSSVCFAPAADFVSHTQIGYSDKFASQSTSGVSLQRSATQSAPSAELWVDGPAEFRTPLQDGVSGSRTVGSLGPAAVARKPAINSDEEQTATSSRPCRWSSGEGVSKSRLPRTSAKKNHSSLRLRHATQPVLDGRITAWVKSVQQASQPPDDDLSQPDAVDVPESQELQETESVLLGHENCEEVKVQEKEETSSMANSSHSLYEREVDESLETASLRGCALISSDDDAASLSNSKVERLRDGVPDGCADDKLYNELQSAAMVENIPVSEDVLRTPVGSSGGTTRRSRLVQPVVRSSSNSSQRGDSNSPSFHRSSSYPRRCLSSPRKNSSLHGSHSPEPSRLKLPATTKTATPTSIRRCSDTVREKSQPSGVKKPTSSADECDKVVTNASSQKSQKALNQKPQQSKSGGSRNADRGGKSSPRSAKVERKSCVPAASKNTSSEAGDGRCLVSPYHTVTSPRRRVAGCSTSSDNSSLLSDAVTARSKSSEVELSSGYESMLRDDSEDTITAHCTDWTSDDNGNGIHGQCTDNCKVCM